ncbi:MAG TPA: arylamine N-acetyltransferase [Pseudonocardiaceae bacterium]|nr:arylamine N-acetyltransferase [Pseudonocardiaceae bacterium]
MNQDGVRDYLHRIGATRPPRADLAGLRHLHEQHQRTVPFENLAIHLGEPVALDEAGLLDKIVTRKRGGFCYELNGAFALLLSALGYHVTLLAARVFGADGIPGAPFDHLALRVALPAPWLVDVGFGKHSRFPLDLRANGDQADPDGVFRIRRAPRGDLDVLRDGTPQYRLETRARELADFGPTCWYQQTSPDSHFTRSMICTRLTESGRISLSDHTLIRTGPDHREERELTDAQALAAYPELFGFSLGQLPEPGEKISRAGRLGN